VFAGGSHPSFALAATMLDHLAEVAISARQVGRITEEVGAEMTRQRDLQTARFQDRTLPAAVAGIPSLAVVEIDGGRFQARDPAAGSGPGAHGVGWKEDKVACLVTMTGAASDHDPHPDLPACFTDKPGVARLVKGLTSQGSLSELTDAADRDETPAAPRRRLPRRPRRRRGHPTRWCGPPWPRPATVTRWGPWWRPRRTPATSTAPRARSSWATAANGSGEFRSFTFRKYTPIVDFVHVLSYIYLVAKAVATSPTEHWETYLRWARACWQGTVATVITELNSWRDRLGPIPADEDVPKTDPRHVVAATLGYLENNQSRMNYPHYCPWHENLH